jgi:hypothetical protein
LTPCPANSRRPRCRGRRAPAPEPLPHEFKATTKGIKATRAARTRAGALAPRIQGDHEGNKSNEEKVAR